MCSESPFETVGRIRSLLKFTAHVYSSSDQHHLQVYCSSLPPHLKLPLPVDQVSLCQVYCSSLLLKLPVSPSSLLPESPSSSVPVKFTTSVTFKFSARVTFKFTAKATLKFTARGHKQCIKFTASVTFKFTPQNCQIKCLRAGHLQIYYQSHLQV